MSESVATQLLALVLERLPLPERLLAAIDDSQTKRYGPKVEGADIHRNPTLGPADQKYLYGHVWVTLSLALRHPEWGALALPLRAMLYVRQRTLAKIPKRRRWKFRTKLDLAAKLVEWIAPIVKKAGKTLWIVVDGFYTKRPFLQRALAAGQENCKVEFAELSAVRRRRGMPQGGSFDGEGASDACGDVVGCVFSVGRSASSSGGAASVCRHGRVDAVGDAGADS